MNCEQARNGLLPANFDGLEDKESQALENHLSTCEACQSLDAEVLDALSLLEAPAVKAPEAAWDKIKSRIHEDIARKPLKPQLKIAVSCTYCKGELERAESVFCGSCLAPHHPACFEEYGRCSNLGCAETRTVKPLETPGRRFPMPALQAKETKPPTRRRAKVAAALIFGATAAFGVAALVDEPKTISSNDIALEAPVARPILKKVRTQYRQILDPRIQDITVDRDGDVWFGLKQEGPEAFQAFKVSFKDALQRKRSGQEDLVIENGLLAVHGDDGRFVAQSAGEDEEAFALVDGVVKAVALPSSSAALGGLDPHIVQLPDGESYLGQDKYGRVFARALSQQIVVYDPWATGRYPKALEDAVAGLPFMNSSQVMLFGSQLPRLYPQGPEPLKLPAISNAYPLKDGGLFFLYKEGGVFYSGQFKSDGTYVAGTQAVLTGRSGSASLISLLESHRDLLTKQLDPTAKSFGPIKLAADEERLWVLDGLELRCLSSEGSQSKLNLDKALKHNALFPAPYDGVFLVQDNRRLDHITVDQGAVTVAKMGVTVADPLELFSGPRETLWHPLSAKNLVECNWQGSNRDELGHEATPKLSLGDKVLAVKNGALVTWDGTWEKRLLPELTKSSRVLHDKASRRLVILSPEKSASLRLRLVNLSGGSKKKSLAAEVDWSVLIPAPAKPDALKASFVASGKLWIGESESQLKAISLPPRVN